MKNILIPVLAILLISHNSAYSQKYSTFIEDQIVTISVDYTTLESALIVTRENEESPSGEIRQSSDLQFVGYFEINANNDVVLDYANNNYYFVPFANNPIMTLNSIFPANTESGIITTNTANAVGPGDRVYNCQCGSWAPDPNTGPGGCVSSFNNKVMRCVEESNNACSEGCRGSFAPESSSIIFTGGGTLISVSKEREDLFYRI